MVGTRVMPCIGDASLPQAFHHVPAIFHPAFRRLSDNASIRITRSTPLSTKSIGSPPCRASARSPAHPQQISVRDQLAFLISKRLSSGRRAGWLAALELGGGACVLPRVGPRGLGFRLQAFSF